MKQDTDQIKTAYTEIAQRMLEFREENVTPIEADFHGLCIGSHLAESLYANQASHHKSCNLLFSSSKLALAKERKSKVNLQSDNNEPGTRRESGKIIRWGSNAFTHSFFVSFTEALLVTVLLAFL